MRDADRARTHERAVTAVEGAERVVDAALVQRQAAVGEAGNVEGLEGRQRFALRLVLELLPDAMVGPRRPVLAAGSD